MAHNMHVDLSKAKESFANAPSALKLTGEIDDSKMLHIGVIGCGRIGQLHAANITHKIPNAMLVCVSDVFESAAIKLANRLQVPMACKDAIDLVNNPAVQAVIVCSPTDTHAEIIRTAAAAGKHIFCEKPVDKSLEVIDELSRVIDDSGSRFFLGFQRRFDIHFQRVRKVREDGQLGRGLKLHLLSRDPSPPPIGYLKQSGGIFLDQASHDFDMARFITGQDIVEITATGMAVNPEIAEIGDLDHTMVTVKFEDGTLGVIDNSRSCALGYDQRAEYFGENGSVSVENVTPNNCSFTSKEGFHAEAPLNFFMDRYADAYVEEMKTFVDCILYEKPMPCGIEDGRKTILYAAAATLSAKEGRTVKVSEVDNANGSKSEAKARY